VAKLRDRPTADLVVLLLTAMVLFVIGFALVGVVVIEVTSSSIDVAKIAGRIAAFTNTIIGAIVGYLAGRGVETPPKDEP
jgi:hypothetical protein